LFDWLKGVIADGGYLGIVLLMLAENVFPRSPADPLGTDHGACWVRGREGRAQRRARRARRVLGSMLGALPCTTPGAGSGRRACAPLPPATPLVDPG
jgi:hypothetical protein